MLGPHGRDAELRLGRGAVRAERSTRARGLRSEPRPSRERAAHRPATRSASWLPAGSRRRCARSWPRCSRCCARCCCRSSSPVPRHSPGATGAAPCCSSRCRSTTCSSRAPSSTSGGSSRRCTTGCWPRPQRPLVLRLRAVGVARPRPRARRPGRVVSGLRGLLSAPVFEDEAQTQQAFMLHVILWALVAVPVPYVLLTVIVAARRHGPRARRGLGRRGGERVPAGPAAQEAPRARLLAPGAGLLHLLHGRGGGRAAECAAPPTRSATA